jgi:fused signal recognition particle receptor
LAKTKSSVFSKITRAIAGKSKVDEALLDELEEILIASDVGVETTLRIIDRLQKRIERDKYLNTSELNQVLKEEISSLLIKPEGRYRRFCDSEGKTICNIWKLVSME